MIDNNDFQNIEENDNTFNAIEEEKKENELFVNTFVMGLPDWDLEPLYESIKRGDKK